MTRKYVYKVVSSWNEETQTGYSATIQRGACHLKYKIGKETKAIKGTTGIVCYDISRNALHSGLHTYGNVNAVLKCEYTGKIRCVDLKLWKAFMWLFDLPTHKKVAAFVNTIGHRMPDVIGSVCVDSVTPVKILRVDYL